MFRGFFNLSKMTTIEKTNPPIEEFPDHESIKTYYDLYIFAKEKRLFDAVGNINFTLIFNSSVRNYLFKPSDRIHFEAQKWSITYTPSFIAEKLAEENYKLRDKHPELTIQEIHTLIHALRNFPPTDLANLSNYELLEKLKEIYNQKQLNIHQKRPF